MLATTKPLRELTASDLMTRHPVPLREDMPLREAARLLWQHQVGGAPVVDAAGKCVGVLSAMDFVRLALKRADPTLPTAPPLPFTCPFQIQHRTPGGRDEVLCILPPGVCPVQVTVKSQGGQERIICSQPHCVLSDWQVVEVEKLPGDEVRHYMTADPIMVSADDPLKALARRMIDAHIHRVIVVDRQEHPIGVVSSTDVLAAVAYDESNQ
jgi:CBS domain-containing protein